MGAAHVLGLPSGSTPPRVAGRRRCPHEALTIPSDTSHEPSVELLIGFLNSRNRLRDEEQLDAPDVASAWLAAAGHPVGVPSTTELERLRGLREALRELIARGGGHEQATAVQELDRRVRDVSFGLRIDASGVPRLVPSSTGVGGFEEAVLCALLAVAGSDEWARLKVCANESCQWAFRDGSKNRSGRWCVMSICGSSAKMRRYRNRGA